MSQLRVPFVKRPFLEWVAVSLFTLLLGALAPFKGSGDGRTEENYFDRSYSDRDPRLVPLIRDAPSIWTTTKILVFLSAITLYYMCTEMKTLEGLGRSILNIVQREESMMTAMKSKMDLMSTRLLSLLQKVSQIIRGQHQLKQGQQQLKAGQAEILRRQDELRQALKQSLEHQTRAVENAQKAQAEIQKYQKQVAELQDTLSKKNENTAAVVGGVAESVRRQQEELSSTNKRLADEEQMLQAQQKITLEQDKEIAKLREKINTLEHQNSGTKTPEGTSSR